MNFELQNTFRGALYSSLYPLQTGISWPVCSNIPHNRKGHATMHIPQKIDVHLPEGSATPYVLGSKHCIWLVVNYLIWEPLQCVCVCVSIFLSLSLSLPLRITNWLALPIPNGLAQSNLDHNTWPWHMSVPVPDFVCTAVLACGCSGAAVSKRAWPTPSGLDLSPSHRHPRRPEGSSQLLKGQPGRVRL